MTAPLLDSTSATRIMQQNLRAWGFDPGEVNGALGPKTIEAIKALQRKLGLTPTGSYDPATVRSVQADLSDPNSILRRQMSMLQTTGPVVDSRPPIGGSRPGTQPQQAQASNALAPIVMLAAGGLLLWLLARKPSVTIDGVGDVLDEEDGEGNDLFAQLNAHKPKTKRKRKHKARAEKQKITPTKASEQVIDVTPEKVETASVDSAAE